LSGSVSICVCAQRADCYNALRTGRAGGTLAATWQNLIGTVPDGAELLRVGLRLLTALFVGAAVGLQRQLTHHSAGFRTHILVALGSALLVISGSQSGMSSADLSRIIQGIVTGIGFLGGGAILKLTAEQEIRGLTTAAGIWMTAATSIAAGLGRIITALIALALTLIVLGVLIKVEKRLDKPWHKGQGATPRGDG
jgi:putative Mg2+ transporter-C (MgtC) family protein